MLLGERGVMGWFSVSFFNFALVLVWHTAHIRYDPGAHLSVFLIGNESIAYTLRATPLLKPKQGEMIRFSHSSIEPRHWCRHMGGFAALVLSFSFSFSSFFFKHVFWGTKKKIFPKEHYIALLISFIAPQINQPITSVKERRAHWNTED